MSFHAEIEFTLPRGYVDAAGQLHRSGTMRLATGLDEIEVLQDPRVQLSEAYLPVLVLSRVLTRLGALSPVPPDIVANLYAIDLAYLEDLYQRFNSPEHVVIGAICPACSTQFQLQVAPL